MKYEIQVLLLLSLVIACNTKNKKELFAEDISFESFFSQFSGNADFQSSRIKFPLKHVYYDDNVIEDEIRAEDWEFIDFGKDSLAASRKEDAYRVEILKKDSASVEYLRQGIDNGISMSFHFRRDDATWFLVEIVDRSN